jgi:hypothetical protein
MILKNKNNDIALRSFSEILDDILQTPEGNIGLILSSSYSINTQVKLMNINRNFTLLDAFRRIPDSVIKLFLLPPPTLFFGNYRKAHANYALELMKARVFVQFDRLVHSKFLLFGPLIIDYILSIVYIMVQQISLMVVSLEILKNSIVIEEVRNIPHIS